MKIKATFKMLTDEYLSRQTVEILLEISKGNKNNNKLKSYTIELDKSEKDIKIIMSVLASYNDLIMIYSDELDFFNTQLICISKDEQWWEVHSYKKHEKSKPLGMLTSYGNSLLKDIEWMPLIPNTPPISLPPGNKNIYENKSNI